MDKDLISVQIVAYNASSTLSRTLESVRSQKNVSIEIVFVNDSSTDDTLSIMEKFASTNSSIPCTIVSNKRNLGITKSRNRALRASKGLYIAVIDSDDTWTSPDKLRDQLDFLTQHPDYLVVGTQMRLVLADGTPLKTTSFATDDANIRSKMLVFNQFCHSSILMRNIGQQYDESLYIWEDHDLLLQLGEQGRYANLNESAVDYLYVSKKYSFGKKMKLISTEFQIIMRYKKKYPNFWLGYVKRVAKLGLVLLHLK